MLPMPLFFCARLPAAAARRGRRPGRPSGRLPLPARGWQTPIERPPRASWRDRGEREGRGGCGTGWEVEVSADNVDGEPCGTAPSQTGDSAPWAPGARVPLLGAAPPSCGPPPARAAYESLSWRGSRGQTGAHGRLVNLGLRDGRHGMRVCGRLPLALGAGLRNGLAPARAPSIATSCLRRWGVAASL